MRAKIMHSASPGMQSVMARVRDTSVESFDRMRNINTNFINNVRDLGNGYLDHVNTVTDTFLNRNNVLRAVQTVSEAGAMNSNITLYNINENNMRRVGYRVRRFNMANPRVQRLYRLNRLNGYDSVWDNNDTISEPRRRLDYHLATDGFVEETNEGLSYSNVYSAEEKLTLYEKTVIRNNWAFLDDLITKGEDPTELI